MKDVTRDEIKDAMQKYIAKGGKIEKIKFNDNGMLLNNDMLLDRNYNGDNPIVDEYKGKSILEPNVVN